MQSHRGLGGRLILCGLALPATMALALLPGPARASPASIASGRRLAETHCKACHTIAGRNPSPVAGAPPFTELQQLSPDRSLDAIFAGALTAGHPPMPNFAGSAQQMQDLLDYVRSVQAASPSR